MSQIRATTRLTVEDYPEQKGWIAKLIGPINDFFTQSIKILNNGILFRDNCIGMEHVYDFTYQSDALTFPRGFLWTVASAPVSFQVVSATQDNQPCNVSASWQFTAEGQVQLVHMVRFTTAPAISALQVGSRYKIRVRVTP